MILDFFLFPVFLVFLYALGMGALRASTEEYPSYVYFIAAFLTLGFTAVVFNFFAGVNSPLFYLIIFAITLSGATRLRRSDLKTIPQFIWLGLILAPFAANMPPGIDAGLYHLPHQLWIRDEKIAFGLANFNTRFGFSSLSEYILAPLWIGEQFKLLSYTAATHFLILLLFLGWLAQSSNARTAAVAAITLVALIFNSKYFVIGYTSTDTPCGILFAITFFYGFFLLCEETLVERKQLTILFLCAVFTLACKVSGAVIFLWVLFIILSLLRARRIAWPLLLQTSILPAFLTLIWLIQGVIVSGCLIYPVASSCLSVPWAATKAAFNNSIVITAWAQQRATNLQPFWDWSWFFNWWWPHHWPFCLYQITTVVFIAGIYRYYCRKELSKRPDITLPALIFTLLCLGIWFIKSPGPRFGIGVFIILPAVIAINIFGFRRLPLINFRAMQQKSMLSTLGGMLVVALAVKLVIVDAAGGRNRAYLHFTMPSVPAMPTMPNANFGVAPLPVGNEQCWLAKYCSADYKSGDSVRESYGYKYFHE